MNLRNTSLLVGITFPTTKLSQLSVSVCMVFPLFLIKKKTLYSLGPRACIGRKFATTESVCFLTLLLRDFKVEPLLRVGETKEQWQDRALEAKIAITLGVVDVPVRFVRRMRK
jgi:hypothetical protein